MARRSPSEVSLLLEQWRAGRAEVLDEIFPLVYDELRRMAGASCGGEPPGNTLQTTALVHEAYLRLTTVAGRLAGPRPLLRRRRPGDASPAGGSRPRRQAPEARRRGAAGRARRGGGSRGDVGRDARRSTKRSAALAELDARQARIVELRYFGGLRVGRSRRPPGVSTPPSNANGAPRTLWLRREIRSRAATPVTPTPAWHRRAKEVCSQRCELDAPSGGSRSVARSRLRRRRRACGSRSSRCCARTSPEDELPGATGQLDFAPLRARAAW